MKLEGLGEGDRLAQAKEPGVVLVQGDLARDRSASALASALAAEQV